MLFCMIIFCDCNGSASKDYSNESIEVSLDSISFNNDSKKYIVFDEDDNAPEAIAYITGVIRNEYNPLSRFVNYPQKMEETEVSGRYKVEGQFLTKILGQDVVLYYSTYVQNFDNQWEYGTLLISNSPNPSLSNAIKILKGHLKEKEQESINKKENGSLGGIDYTIIKRSAPNYIVIYTPNRLSKKEIIKFYKEFKDQYEILQFTINKNPDHDEYLSIQYGLVIDYEKDNVTNLKDYLKK